MWQRPKQTNPTLGLSLSLKHYKLFFIDETKAHLTPKLVV